MPEKTERGVFAADRRSVPPPAGAFPFAQPLAGSNRKPSPQRLI